MADCIKAAAFLYVEDVIDEDEFVVVTAEFEKNASIFPYWKYERFETRKKRNKPVTSGTSKEQVNNKRNKQGIRQ